MTFPEALDLFEYWQEVPPENELLAILVRAQTNWEPGSVSSMTEDQAQEANRQAVERRWASGQALSPKQLLEAFGGGKVGIGSDGVYRSADGRPIPGVHRHPGMLPAESNVK